MCGRFTTTTTAAALADWFEVDEAEVDEVGPNFNVTPTSDIYTVVEDPDGQRRLDLMFWGLVPQWAESPAIGSKMINARSETAATKPSFRAAFRRRRCIIPVDGFYEWVEVPGRKKKQPMYITARSREPLAFAGLWEQWRPNGDSVDDTTLTSCAILTGPPNELIAPLHDRMPMILPRRSWKQWLDPSNDDVDALQSLLVPAPEELLEHWPVSVDVNNVRNRDAHLIEPCEIVPDGQVPGQGTLL